MKKSLIALMIVLATSTVAFADLENTGDYETTHATLSTGYYWVETEDNSGRAAEYRYQDVSGTAAFNVTGGTNKGHFIVDGNFQNENDYRFNVHVDRDSGVRLDLRAEKLFHNLDHIFYDNGSTFDAIFTVGGSPEPRGDFLDNDLNDDYELKGSIYEANARFKLPDMPAHFTINYWQYHKEGTKQLRYISKDCTGCHLTSKSQDINRTTHQVSGGFDAHLGKYDLIVSHTYRELTIDEPIPSDSFGEVAGGPNIYRTASVDSGLDYEHSAIPESQLNETTVELHSSLAGGVNIAASGTLGNRKNNSQVSDVSPIVSETDYWKAALDIVHTTSPKFTYNFKSRYLDMDPDNTYPDQITSVSFGAATGAAVDVRPPLDLKRAIYEINTTCRPNKKISFRVNLGVETIERENIDTTLTWDLPKDETIAKAKIGFLSQPLQNRRLKLNGWYQYKNSSDPAYGAALEDSHEVFFSSGYTAKQNWGLNFSARGLLELKDNFERELEGDTLTRIEELDRERQQQNINFGVWYNMSPGLNMSLNYGYARTSITQDLLFGVNPADDFNSPSDGIPEEDYVIKDDDVEFLQEVSTVSGTIGYNPGSFYKISLSGYYTRSLAHYAPNFPTDSFLYDQGGRTGTASSDGLKEITHYDIDQYGAKASIDYYFTPDFELTMSYTYDDYDEKYTNEFDGSVQTAMASLGYRW